MSTKAPSKKFSFRSVSKVARKLSFRSSKPVAKATSPATEDLETLSRTSSYALLPTSLSGNHQQPVEEIPEPEPKKQDPEVEAAKLRVARRFFLKRTKRFYGTQEYLAQCPISDRGRVIKSLMSNIKDSVKSTLSQALPKTKTLTKMTNTMVNTLNQSLPECFRYLGISPIGDSQRGVKRKRDCEQGNNEAAYMSGLNLMRRQDPNKKKCDNKPDDFIFTEPKTYECGFCNKKYFHHLAFFNHIKHHKDLMRCRACYKKFDNYIQKKHHEVKCLYRAVL